MSDSITVDKSDGTDVTYYEVTPMKPGTREFRVTSDTNATMRRFVHESTYRKSPSSGVDRRRFYFSRNIEDVETGVIHTCSLVVELVLPPTEDAVSSVYSDLISAAIAILARNSAGVVDYANVAAIMSGFLPTGDLAA